MAVFRLLLTLTFLCFYVTFIQAGSGYDAELNFCRRLGHASAFKNQKVYINSGFETFADRDANNAIETNTITSGFNLVLMSVNMTSDWGGSIPIPVDEDAKHKSNNLSAYITPPNYKYSALYAGPANSTKMYSFGGTSAGYNTSFHDYFMPPDTSIPLWSYDSTTDRWTNVDTSMQNITMPSYGASAEAPDLGLGFYLGGQIDNGTANSTSFLASPVGLGGMIVIDTVEGSLWNMSAPASIISNRQGGAMVYTSAFGKAGILIAIGGQSAGRSLTMEQIQIFDVSTIDSARPNDSTNTVNTWYTVNTTGTIPTGRTDFCAVVTTAQDGSSTNVYVYGGRSGNNVFDEVYVLSIPSFTWTRIHSGNYPRWGMTCQLVSPSQMMVVGGANSTNVTADCDWLESGFGILDLSTVDSQNGLASSSNFQFNATTYDVPAGVISTIGGNGVGGATLLAPAGGWSNTALKDLFKLSIKNSTATPSSSPNAKENNNGTSLSTGAKAGIAVGVIVVAIISLSLAFLLRRRSRNKRRSGTIIPPGRGFELDGRPQGTAVYEKTGTSRTELMTGDSQSRAEKDSTVVHEIPANHSTDLTRSQPLHERGLLELE